MTVAATGALVIGAAEEAALVVFLFAVGEVLEGLAAEKARASIRALADLIPKTALIEENGETREVDASTLAIGQRVLVRPGDRIPADGEIAEGTSGIDESPVTGESMPKTKGPGDVGFAGFTWDHLLFPLLCVLRIVRTWGGLLVQLPQHHTCGRFQCHRGGPCQRT